VGGFLISFGSENCNHSFKQSFKAGLWEKYSTWSPLTWRPVAGLDAAAQRPATISCNSPLVFAKTETDGTSWEATANPQASPIHNQFKQTFLGI
jgi:hypothetical protein